MIYLITTILSAIVAICFSSHWNWRTAVTVTLTFETPPSSGLSLAIFSRYFQVLDPASRSHSLMTSETSRNLQTLCYVITECPPSQGLLLISPELRSLLLVALFLAWKMHSQVRWKTTGKHFYLKLVMTFPMSTEVHTWMGIRSSI